MCQCNWCAQVHTLSINSETWCIQFAVVNIFASSLLFSCYSSHCYRRHRQCVTVATNATYRSITKHGRVCRTICSSFPPHSRHVVKYPFVIYEKRKPLKIERFLRVGDCGVCVCAYFHGYKFVHSKGLFSNLILLLLLVAAMLSLCSRISLLLLGILTE